MKVNSEHIKTNGEMMMDTFPIKVVSHFEDQVCVEFKGMYKIMLFTESWWNAPYEKGKE